MGNSTRQFAHNVDTPFGHAARAAAGGTQPATSDALAEGRGTWVGVRTVLEAYESSPDLRAAATEVDDRWTEQHWIHGNVSASTVIVEHWPALRVSFIDLEDAGRGDPAWDLASAVDTIDLLAPRWRVMPQLLLDYLLLGYRRAGGPARLYPAMQAVRALTTALQAGSEDESNWPKGERADVTVLLERARGYAARVGCLRAVA